MHPAQAARFSILALLIAAGVAFLLAEEQDPWRKKALLETPQRMAALQNAPNKVAGWPPALGVRFPNLDLYDHEGQKFSIESLRGKPVLIEMVAMSCAGCQAFSGGKHFGGYGGFPSQQGLDSIEDYLKSYGSGTDLFGPKLSFVQIIVYNLSLAAPNAIELAAWRAHFKLQKPNTHVVSGGEALANRESFKMIPGFILLDKDLTVRYNSTGHRPLHNLYTQLLPAVPGLLGR